MAEITYKSYIISAGRYRRGPITARLLSNYSHIVRKSQEQLYLDNGFKNVIGVEDELINDYCKVFNYVVENTPEDVVGIIDDDIDKFIYRTADTSVIESIDIVDAELERLAQMIYDLDIGLATGPPTRAPYNYTSEFRWSGIPGAFKIVNKKAIKARMDPDILRHADIDYVMQELLMNRVILDAMYLCVIAYTDKDTRVTGQPYSKSDIMASVEQMKLRWGKHFTYNEKRNVPKILVER